VKVSSRGGDEVDATGSVRAGTDNRKKEASMRSLFDTTAIKSMQLRNRLVRSATWEGMCEEDGRPTQRLIDLYVALARGGIGLIVTGFAFVRPDGRQLPRKMGIHTDAFADEFRKMTEAVHDAGGRIAIQLVHAGGQTNAAAAGRRPLAPSAVEAEQFPEVPEELSAAEIRAITAAFGDAARRAQDWGFDAVQLHGAHGYLINQFLSPHTNRRTDEYGGGIDNRCRFLMEAYHQVRAAVGDEYPVLIKLNGADNLPGGLVLEDAVFAARLLARSGIDAIEVSGGTPASGKETPVRLQIDEPGKEAYHLGSARRIREEVSCPVMVVGGIRSFETAEQAVDEAGMDYISMARPLIREPALANRWRGGDRRPATCISCNGCFGPGLKEGGIYCVQEKKGARH